MLRQPDLIKRIYFSSFVQNEGKLLNLYNEAGTDLLKTKNSILYKNINYIILIPFLLGLLIQLISLFFAKYIALLAIIISFSPMWFSFILLINSLGIFEMIRYRIEYEDIECQLNEIERLITNFDPSQCELIMYKLKNVKDQLSKIGGPRQHELRVRRANLQRRFEEDLRSIQKSVEIP